MRIFLYHDHEMLMRGHDIAKSRSQDTNLWPWDANCRLPKLKGMLSSKGTTRIHNYNGTNINKSMNNTKFYKAKTGVRPGASKVLAFLVPLY